MGSKEKNQNKREEKGKRWRLILQEFVPESSLFAPCTVGRGTPRFAERKDLLTRQPSEKVGEQSSHLPRDIYGRERQGDLRHGECGRKMGREGKSEGIVVLPRCNQAVNTCFFTGHVFRKGLCQPVLKVEFRVFWYQKVTNGILNTCPFGGLNHFYSFGAQASEQLTPNSWKTTWANISLFKLCHAWRTYKLL